PNWKTGTDSRTIKGSLVSTDFFTVFGTQTLIGRTLTPADARNSAAPVAVIAESLWADAFATNPAVIGRRFVLNDTDFTIVGVVADASQFPPNQEVWASLEAVGSPKVLNDASARSITAIGTLAAGTDAAKAQTEIRAIAAAGTSGEARVSDAGLVVTV